MYVGGTSTCPTPKTEVVWRKLRDETRKNGRFQNGLHAGKGKFEEFLKPEKGSVRQEENILRKSYDDSGERISKGKEFVLKKGGLLWGPERS